jgi:hypothetical protein
MFNEPAATPDEAPESKGSGMKKLLAVFTVILLAALGVRIYLIHRERVEANKPAAEAAAPSYTEDQLVLPRRLHQADLKDAKDLNGKRVWVWAAGQLNAYPATPARMDYTHPGPLLLGAEPLEVVNFIEGKAPASAYSRVPKGDAQVFMLFHRKADPDKLWGTPVGYREGKVYTFFLDECFFYDDPHTLYKHWPADVWKAIDEHRAIKGMSEMEAQLALGQVSKPGPGSMGDRTVVYDNDSHPVTITFVDNKATSIS